MIFHTVNKKNGDNNGVRMETGRKGGELEADREKGNLLVRGNPERPSGTERRRDEER